MKKITNVFILFSLVSLFLIPCSVMGISFQYPFSDFSASLGLYSRLPTSLFNAWDQSSLFAPWQQSSLYNPWDQSSLFNSRQQTSLFNVWDQSSLFAPWQQSTLFSPWQQSSLYNPWDQSSPFNSRQQTSLFPPWKFPSFIGLFPDPVFPQPWPLPIPTPKPMPPWNPYPKITRSPKLIYRVETDKGIYTPGDTIDITLTVENKGNASAVIKFNSGQRFDVIIKDESGGKVWQFSDGQGFIQVTGKITIGVGQKQTYDTQWTAPDAVGDSYKIEAFLTSTEEKYNKVTFTYIGIETLPRFMNCQDLRDKLKELRDAQTPVYRPIIWWPIMPFFSNTFFSGFSSGGGVDYTFAALPTEPSGSSGETTSYSTTNIQVAGVDEADVVKNDATYIYMIKNDSVRIVRARPIYMMEELTNISFAGTNFIPAQLYVDGNILVVIGRECAFSKVYIYDITDRENVSPTRTLKFKAQYLQSRKVDDILYVIMKDNPPKDLDSSDLLPTYYDSGVHSSVSDSDPICNCSDITFLPGYSEPNYLIIAGIDIDNPQTPTGRELILGKSENVYASRENLYVTSTAYLNQEVVFRPWIFFIPWTSKPSTMVYKFNLEGGSAAFAGQAKVPGTTKNQFCMDEHVAGTETYFRIATTIRSLSESSLYVLDEGMQIAGFLEDITQDYSREELKAVRFMGDRAYVVTFERIDPLFVISLEDHTHPQLLGELHVPGYSEYLHPYDDDYLIGFGRDVQNIELGIKLSLFDVSDMDDPTVVETVNIGYRRTDSELLRDHKALLFSKEKNLLAFPVTETEHTYPGNIYSYKYVFQGAYVFMIDELGFEETTQRTHHDLSIFPKASRNWNRDDDIRRIIYINDYMYTISVSQIRAVNMNNYPPNPEDFDEVFLLE